MKTTFTEVLTYCSQRVASLPIKTPYYGREAFVMIMSFFCKDPRPIFGIESGYALLNLIPIRVLEKAFQDIVRYLTGATGDRLNPCGVSKL